MIKIEIDGNKINTLLDRAIAERRKTVRRYGEYHLFKEAMGNNKAMRNAFSKFLHNVPSCPQAVLDLATRIAPPAEAREQEQRKAA